MSLRVRVGRAQRVGPVTCRLGLGGRLETDSVNHLHGFCVLMAAVPSILRPEPSPRRSEHSRCPTRSKTARAYPTHARAGFAGGHWPKGRTHGDSMPTTRLLCRPRSPSWRANFDGNLLRLLRPSRPRVQSARPDHLTAAPFPALDAARYPSGQDSSSQANQRSLDGFSRPSC